MAPDHRRDLLSSSYRYGGRPGYTERMRFEIWTIQPIGAGFVKFLAPIPGLVSSGLLYL